MRFRLLINAFQCLLSCFVAENLQQEWEKHSRASIGRSQDWTEGFPEPWRHRSSKAPLQLPKSVFVQILSMLANTLIE